jgi:hypothetical protein
MRKILAPLLIGLAAMALTSCTSMQSEHYVGVKEPVGENDLKDDTIWQYRDRVYFLRVIDPTTMIAATVDWDEEAGRHKVVTTDIAVTKLDDHLFLNIREQGEPHYSIFRLAPSMDGPIALFTVNRDVLEEDLRAGKIKAVKGQNSIILEMTKAELDAYVRDNHFTLFNTDAAGIIFPLNRNSP